MDQDPKDEDGGELRVEHVIAALNQIGALTAQLHKAVGGLDPKTVLGRIPIVRGPPGTELVGMCRPSPTEPQ
jgi:hypothetical protein